MPKGPAIQGSTGKKDLDSNGFDPKTEIKVQYGSIAESGWTRAIDRTTNQYDYNFWDGNPWMTSPNIARYRIFSLPKSKNQLKYTFGYRYRSGHPNFACLSSDTANISHSAKLDIPLDDTNRICGVFYITLDAGKFEHAIYNWNTGDTTQLNGVSISGIYTVTITTPYCKTSKSTFVIDGCVGVKENLENGVTIRLFPNPASTMVNLELFGAKWETTQLRILNLMGSEVSKSIFNTSEANNSLEIDVSDLASGVYLFEIINGGSYSTYRVVIE